MIMIYVSLLGYFIQVDPQVMFLSHSIYHPSCHTKKTPTGQNNLQGPIPRELASLPLTAIDFLTNGLTGSIPEEMYTLKDLNYLNLGYNELTGTVASELGNLDKFSE